MARLFLKNAPGMANRLQAASKARDLTEMKQVAHKLKGMAAFFTEQGVCIHAGQLEQAASDGRMAEARKIAAALPRSLNILFSELEILSKKETWHG